MSDHEGPRPKAPPPKPQPAPADRTPGGGVTSTLPRSGAPSARVKAMASARSQAIDEARFRMTGGAQGTPPAARIAAQRRDATAAAVGRFMRKADGPAKGAPKLPSGGGSPLPGGTRQQMEKRLGADLSGVRVHTGSDAAAAAGKLGARAFTMGNDVHFNAGQFAPGSKEGDRLLAHELTHVVQGQRSGIQRKAEEGAPAASPSGAEGAAAGAEGAPAEAKGGEAAPEVSDPNEPAEKEADAVADQVADGMHGEEAEGQEAKGKGGKKKKGKNKDTAGAEAGAEADGAEADGAEADGAEADAAAAGAEGGAEAEAGAEGAKEAKEAKEQPAQISAKLEGVGTKLYRYAAEHQAYEDEHERLFEEQKREALAQAPSATSLDGIQTVLGGLGPLFAKNQSVAGQMIGKLKTAMSQAQAVWAQEDAVAAAEGKPPKAPQKKADFIDSRLAKVAAVAPTAITNKMNAATKEKPLDVKDAFWGIVSSDWSICAPEEEASDDLLNDIGGVYKAFDAGEFYSKMDPALQAKWEDNGGLAKWMEGVSSGQPLPVAPPGLEADPVVKPFKDGAKPAYPGTVSGFISTAKALDDPKVMSADKAGVIQLLALQPGRYPSPKMILAKMGAAGAGEQRAATAGGPKPAKLGKPSMFYLIAFPENVYDATNRQVGMTAGGQPELQTTDMPAQAFLMDAPPMVKA